MRHPEPHIFAQTPDSLRDWCSSRGLPPFRAGQILEWVYRHGQTDPARMTNLAKRERELLAREMCFISGETLADRTASDGTRKLLVQWVDAGQTPPTGPSPEQSPATRLSVLNGPAVGDPSRQTECVMIPSLDPSGARRTACISSQVGCPVGCRFCASGLGGLDGNLPAGRIVEQVWLLDRLLKTPGPNGDSGAGLRPAEESGGAALQPAPSDAQPRITNVVFMGMGEPLANFSNVLHAVRTIAAPWGKGISARRITISTVGMPRAIERLAEQLELPVTLALSLHAPNDGLRRELIPWAEYSTIAELLAACGRWFKKTGREVTLEYILLGGVNDRPEHARELAALAKTLRSNVNLIRYNEVAGLPFSRPRTDDVRQFQGILRQRGVNAHIRASRGRDIEAACGQLRHESASTAPAPGTGR
jgi:23S rRNA (adenine2503-C2)-methyltransferase